MARLSTFLAASLMACSLALVGCPERQEEPTPILPAPTRPAAVLPAPARPAIVPPRAPVAALPPAPRQKPRVLGPVGPAIVLLPEGGMTEPSIRVRIGKISDQKPAPRSSGYRGRLEVVRTPAGKYALVNILPMDSYLAGVLSKELYGNWDSQAYEAQAIAARTFALYQVLTRPAGQPWDVNGDETSQVYGGVKAESRKARAAVDATRGRVLLANVQNHWGVFCAFYSACTGGASQDPFEAWGDPNVPPLPARNTGSLDANCPKYRWPPIAIDKEELTRVIQSWGRLNGDPLLANFGPVRQAAVTRRNAATGRPTEITLTDAANRHALMRAEEFRLALLDDPLAAAPRPPSSYCDLADEGGSVILTNGRGYGHGIGLSQWGAQTLAASGHSAADILRYYYPGSQVQTAWR